MVVSMGRSAWQHTGHFLTLVAVVMAATLAANAAPQENSSGDRDQDRGCSNLGQYIFVGGTGGFDALAHGDQFQELLKTGHVGLYEHANAISAAEESPGLLSAIEQVFNGTGSGEAKR